jgi:hypothetical protein
MALEPLCGSDTWPLVDRAFEFRVPFLGWEEEAKRFIWIVVESRVLASHITTGPLGSLPFGASQIKSTILTRFGNAQQSRFDPVVKVVTYVPVAGHSDSTPEGGRISF